LRLYQKILLDLQATHDLFTVDKILQIRIRIHLAHERVAGAFTHENERPETLLIPLYAALDA